MGLMGAGAVTMALFLMMGGSMFPGDKGIVQIEFGIYPEELEGCEVEVDGEIVGKLQYFGAATRTGYELEEGDHMVRVIHPEFRMEPYRVEVTSGQTHLFLLDIGGARTADGEEYSALYFQ